MWHTLASSILTGKKSCVSTLRVQNFVLFSIKKNQVIKIDILTMTIKHIVKLESIKINHVQHLPNPLIQIPVNESMACYKFFKIFYLV